MLWGVDLGGTKIEGAVLDGHPSKTLCRFRIPSHSAEGYERVLSQIKQLLSKMESEVNASPRCVGFGTPGTLDPRSGLLKNSNSVCLNGMPLHADLQELLGTQVELANDANCFALAEASFGTAAGAKSVFGLIMGTGVGGGIVVDGKLIGGAQGIAGEWGHNPLEPGGALCYCGKTGCVETVLSGPALERYYHTQAGQHLGLKDIVALARTGSDEHAIATMNRLVTFFGRALSTVINILDPEVVVLGGGVGNIDELYSLGVESLEQNVFNPELLTQVRRPTLGDSAGVFGAAQLTINHAE